MFGERLKELRKEKGLSQSELARAFGTNKSTICNYETLYRVSRAS
jgi:transcriptional regulator with XRE-family HTH domain